MKLQMPMTVIVLLVMLYSCLVLADYHNFPYDDGAEHGAVVREWAHNLLKPGEPMLSEYRGTSARYTPSSLLMACLARLVRIETPTVLKFCSIIYFGFFVTALSFFAAAYFDDRRAVIWSLAAVLFLWGNGWTGANAYMFSAILTTAYFPSLVSFSSALFALYFQLRFFKTGFFSAAALQYGFAAAAFVCHPLTWLFYCVCSALICFERQGKTPVILLRTMTLSVVSALLAALLWPYYDFWQNFFNVSSGDLAKTAVDYRMTREYLYSDVLLRVGPALSGIAAVLFFLKKRQYIMLWGGCGVFACIYAAGYFFKISLAERSIFFAVFLLQLSFVRVCCLSCSVESSRSSTVLGKKVAAVCCGLLLCGFAVQARLVWTDFLQPCFFLRSVFPFFRYESPNKVQQGLAEVFGPGDVVLTDIFSGWSIPVYTGARVVALLHTPPHIPDNNFRVDDTNNFFIPDRPFDEKWEILRRFSPSHILLNYRIMGPDMEPVLRSMGFEAVAREETYVVFKASIDNSCMATIRKAAGLY